MSKYKKNKVSESDVKPVKIPPPTNSMAVITGIFLIFLAFLFYPVIIELSGDDIFLLPNESGFYCNIFSLSKEYVFFAFSIFAVLFFLGERIFSERPPKYAILEKQARVFLIIGAVYMIPVILSSFMAEYKHMVLWGFWDDTEGFAAIFGYMVMFFTAYNYIRTDRQRTLFYRCIFIMCLIMSVLTVLEYYGLALPSLLLGDMTFAGMVYLTFGNQTKFGSMCVLMFPPVLAYAMAEKRLPLKIVKTLVPLGLIFGVIVSGSSAAFYAFIIEIILLIIINIFKIKVPLKKLLVIFSAIAVIITIALVMSAPLLNQFYDAVVNPEIANDREDFYYLKYIDIIDEGIYVEGYNGESFVIPRSIDEAMTFTENNTNENIAYAWTNKLLTVDFGYNTPVYFYYYEGDVYYIGANNIPLYDLQEPLFPELAKYYSLATGRGYIWLNTLPIVKESIFIGKGPGNFTYNFPQYEVAGMLNTHKVNNVITSKPHNWFLQVAVNSGVISLIVLSVFLFTAVRRGFKGAASFMDYAVLTSCCVFIIMGAVNDSDVCVSPFFWVLLGLCANNKHNI